MDDTYARILLKIDEEYREDAIEVFRWLCFAVRPIRLDEMVDVLAVDTENVPYFDPDRRLPDPQDIVTICSSLVTTVTRPMRYKEYPGDAENLVGHNDDISMQTGDAMEATCATTKASQEGKEIVYLRLAHFSVKEYLISERIRDGPASKYSISEILANLSITYTCLGYISHFDKPISWTSELLQQFPLVMYAARYWERHYGALDEDTCGSQLDRLVMNFFEPENEGFINCVRLKEYYYPGQCDEDGLTLRLYCAATTGLLAVVTALLADMDVDAWCPGHGTALVAACEDGHEDIVKLLLDRGADINRETHVCSNQIRTALQTASLRGHVRLVELLLNRGANIDLQTGKDKETALSLASTFGNEEVVKLLLDKRAKVDLQSGSYGCALHGALAHGQRKVVNLLLHRGADGNLQGGSYGSALQAASRQGYTEVMEQLLDAGANINAQGGRYGIALMAATASGDINTVELLLHKGADINCALEGAYAVGFAIAGGSEEIAKLLLDKRANIITEEHYRHALETAMILGKTEAFKLLLDLGVDSNVRGAHGNAMQTALYWLEQTTIAIEAKKKNELPAGSFVFESEEFLIHTREGIEAIVKLLQTRIAEHNAQSLDSSSKLDDL